MEKQNAFFNVKIRCALLKDIYFNIQGEISY